MLNVRENEEKKRKRKFDSKTFYSIYTFKSHAKLKMQLHQLNETILLFVSITNSISILFITYEDQNFYLFHVIDGPCHL